MTTTANASLLIKAQRMYLYRLATRNWRLETASGTSVVAVAMSLIVAVTVASCRKSPPQPPAAPIASATVPSPSAQPWDQDIPWIDGLRHRAGDEPLFLVRGGSGMVVGRTPSGKVTRELVTSDAKLPLLDGGLELLWLHEGEKLFVVDLRDKRPTRILIGRGLPKLAALWVQGTVRGRSIDVSRPPRCPIDLTIMLDWDDEPTLRISRNDEPDDKEGKEDRKVRLVGQAWLKANLDREGAPHPHFLTPWRDGEKSTANLPPPINRCGIGMDCSKMIVFGQRGWYLVIAGGDTNGDPQVECERYTCLLLDPATKSFASPLDPSRWGKAETVTPAPCHTFYFSASGSHYLGEGKVCGLVGGCADIGGEALGWLPTSAWISI